MTWRATAHQWRLTTEPQRTMLRPRLGKQSKMPPLALLLAQPSLAWPRLLLEEGAERAVGVVAVVVAVERVGAERGLPVGEGGHLALEPAQPWLRRRIRPKDPALVGRVARTLNQMPLWP